MKNPDLTVVVCTYNRPELLENCLRSLRSQKTDNKYEIVVVDNSPSKSAEKISRSIKGVKYLHEKRKGLSNARNIGWKNASGEYIAYIDDDSIAESNWIEKIFRFKKDHPKVTVFGGPYDRYSNSKIPNWIPVEMGTMINGKKKKKLAIGREWLSGTNMIYKKSILKKFNGFKDNFGMKGDSIGYGEETDLQMRLHKAGIEIYYNPKIKVSHLFDEKKMNLQWQLKNKLYLGKTIVKTHGRNDNILYHLVSFAHKTYLLLYYLLYPEPMPIKRRIYYSVGGALSAIGAFQNYLENKLKYIRTA